MAKKITTLFVRDNSVNVVVVDGQRVTKWATGPLEAGLVVQGLVTDEAKVAMAIRDLFKQNGIGGGKVVAGISGANTLYRMITLPEMPDALLGEAVRREARRVLPVSLDEVNLSHQEVPSVSKGEKRLFLATYPKNTTEAMIRTLRQAGLTPYLMDLAPLALGRVPNEPRAVIVNVRGNQADIIVVEDRLPQLIRVLSLPAEAGSLDEKLPAVTEELNRTVVFYNSSHAEKPLSNAVPLFVCGELCEDEAKWPQLAGRLNFPVSRLPVSLEHGDDFPVNDFVVNIGLALKEFAVKPDEYSSVVNLNILPEAYHAKRIPLAAVLVPVFAVIGIGIVAYMASFVYRGRNDTARLRDQATQSAAPIAAQTQQVASLKAEVTRVTPLSAPIDVQVSQINARTNAFRSTMTGLQMNRAKINDDLKRRITATLPSNKENLTLTSVNHDGETISVTGVAASEEYIFQYTRKLRESGIGVIVSSIQATGAVPISETDTVTPKYEFSLIVK